MSKDTKTLRITCSRCGVATQADVWSYYHWSDANSPVKPSESYFVVCTGCGQPSLVEIYQDRSKLFESLSVEKAVRGAIGNGWEWKKQFPVEHIPDAPKHLPETIETFYLEACGCLLHGFSNAAGAMFRKSLEASTRADTIRNQLSEDIRTKFDNSMLSARLNFIKNEGIIPSTLLEIAKTIKLEGNEAVHGMANYTIEDAHGLKGFVDAFLTYVFTLPFQMKRVRTAENQSITSEKQ